MAGEMKVMNIHKIFAKHDTDLTQIEGVMNTWFYPLTRAEVITGKFDLAPAPNDVFTSEDQACMVWQEVTLPGSVINGLGGRTTASEDELITVAYFVYGHTDPAQVTNADPLTSYVYFPVLEVLTMVPTINVNGNDEAEWLPKTLLSQSRMQPTYRDGFNPGGISMFELRPKSLQEETDGFLEGEEEQVANATEQFMPTPAKQRPTIPVIATSSYTGSSVWEKYAKEVQSTDAPASPGKPLQYVPQLPCSVSNTTSVVGPSSETAQIRANVE